MPCVSNYMQPCAREKESVNLIKLLNEVGINVRGDKVYGDVKNLDKHTALLCEFCQGVDVTKYSLELQIWWRDHHKADKDRLTREAEKVKTEAEKQAVLDKLTPCERKLLGV